MKTEDGSERHRKSKLKTDDGIAGTPTGYSLNVFPLFFHKYENMGSPAGMKRMPARRSGRYFREGGSVYDPKK